MMAPFTPINSDSCEFSLSSTDARSSTHNLPSYQPTKPGKLREVIMYAVQSLELFKRNTVAKNEKEAVQKRKLPPHAQAFDSPGKSVPKRQKIAERKVNESSKANMMALGLPTALSATTVSKLNAFRFQASLDPRGIPKDRTQRFSFTNSLQHVEKHKEFTLSSDASDIPTSCLEKASSASKYTEFAHAPYTPERVQYNDDFDASNQKEQNRRARLHDMDGLDESIFDQIIADNEADWAQLPPSAYPLTACFAIDPVRTPSKSALMQPPHFAAPATLPAKSTYIRHANSAVSSVAPLSPFVRAGAKAPTFLSSSIPNLSSTGRIPTCFRLAELLRHISGTRPFEPDGVLPIAQIELFATVTASSRYQNGTAQTFTFADLFFPQRPPYIEGTYMRCAESELLDDDSRPFLESRKSGHGILARAIVRSRKQSSRDTHGSPRVRMCGTTELQILNIWACTWDDVEYTKGIVIPELAASYEVTSRKTAKFVPLRPTSGHVPPGESTSAKAT